MSTNRFHKHAHRYRSNQAIHTSGKHDTTSSAVFTSLLNNHSVRWCVYLRTVCSWVLLLFAKKVPLFSKRLQKLLTVLNPHTNATEEEPHGNRMQHGAAQVRVGKNICSSMCSVRLEQMSVKVQLSTVHVRSCCRLSDPCALNLRLCVLDFQPPLNILLTH